MWQRVICFLAGVVWPVLCFAMVWSEAPDKPRWQSGQMSDYVKLMLGGAPVLPMYPLLIYAMLSLSLLLVSFDRFVRLAWLRFGVYTGVVLAGHYLVLFWLVFGLLDSWNGVATAIGWLLGCVTILGIAMFMGWLHRRIGWRKFLIVCVSLYLAITVFTAVVNPEELQGSRILGGLLMPFGVMYLLGILSAPCYTLIAFFALSWRIVGTRMNKPPRFTLAQVMSVTTWIASYLSLARWTVILALREYEKLPVEPRGRCYIATAANQGHAWLVGSWEVRCRDGSRRRVNRQLQHLKHFEIALAALVPRMHHALRSFYDVVGPLFAAMLCTPVLADIAYLLLKPAEWFAVVVLRMILGPSRVGL